jgi:hypothetical protein
MRNGEKVARGATKSLQGEFQLCFYFFVKIMIGLPLAACLSAASDSSK